MALGMIGPNRRQRTRVGEYRRAGVWLTLADVGGAAAGVALAVLLILLLLP
jgi:hypothetical protein